MSDIMIIDSSNYTLEHGIYIVNKDTGEVIEKLQLPTPEIIAYIKTKDKIHEIKINAPKDYGEKLKEDIQEMLATEYANRNIEIEVI